MRNIFITVTLLFFSNQIYSQSSFCSGFKKGFIEGYKDVAGQYSNAPNAPNCPIPKVGRDSYNDGFLRGSDLGRSRARSKANANNDLIEGQKRLGESNQFVDYGETIKKGINNSTSSSSVPSGGYASEIQEIDTDLPDGTYFEGTALVRNYLAIGGYYDLIKGKQTFSNGDTFIGSYKNDKFQNGIYTYANNGIKINGQWNKGKILSGTITYPDNIDVDLLPVWLVIAYNINSNDQIPVSYKGELDSEYKFDGEGILTFRNGKKLSGKFKKGIYKK